MGYFETSSGYVVTSLYDLQWKILYEGHDVYTAKNIALREQEDGGIVRCNYYEYGDLVTEIDLDEDQ